METNLDNSERFSGVKTEVFIVFVLFDQILIFKIIFRHSRVQVQLLTPDLMPIKVNQTQSTQTKLQSLVIKITLPQCQLHLFNKSTSKKNLSMRLYFVIL